MTKKPPRLPLVGISEIDLNGVLFVEFPTSWNMEKSRDVLERLIRLAGFVEISHLTIYIAFAEERRMAFERLPQSEKAKLIKAAWAERARRFPPKKKTHNIQDWSF